MDTISATAPQQQCGDSSPDDKRPYLKGFTLRKIPRLSSTSSTPLEGHFYGELIEQLTLQRKAKGWSQEDLSQRIGVSDGMVAKWESGHKLPSSFYLMSWAMALGLTIRVE